MGSPRSAGTIERPSNVPFRGSGAPAISSLRGGIRQPQGGETVLCSVLRAPREDNGEEYSEYRRMHRRTVEYVSLEVLGETSIRVFRF